MTHSFKIITNHPVALESHDQIYPRGARQDNTHCPAFVAQFIRFHHQKTAGFPAVLDLGCAGGGLVKDFLNSGCVACGVDGSDYPVNHKSGEWGVIPANLFCADITKPFTVSAGSGSPFQFDMVTMWDVLEHIRENDLPGLLGNIHKHLKPGGLFTASISTVPDSDGTATWHVTVKDRKFWNDLLGGHGLAELKPSPFTTFPRGSANRLATGDWSGESMGFHSVRVKT